MPSDLPENKAAIEGIDLHWIIRQTGPLGPGDAAVFDIDSTIMDTAPRNLAILKEAEGMFPALKGIADQVGEEGMGWNVCDTAADMVNLGPEERKGFRQFWTERFFASPYLLLDRPYPGVRELLTGLVGLGVEVDYLTGRDEPGMKEGTVESFRKHSLPVGKGTRFIFKPHFDDSDLEFKTNVCASIAGDRRLVLIVENEPANANMFHDFHPDALVLLIDTITAPGPAIPAAGLIRFRSYRRA